MPVEHEFYDYAEGGISLIAGWLDRIPDEVKVKLTQRLLLLRGLGPGEWKRPIVDTLTEGECNGLFEIRAARSRIQYRILGHHGPGRRQPTLLYCFTKKGDRVPESDCRDAQERRKRVYARPAQYQVEHDFGRG